MPGSLAHGLAYFSEIAWRTLPLKGRPSISRFAADVMSSDCILSDAKARRERGYNPPLTIEAGLAAVAAKSAQGR